VPPPPGICRRCRITSVEEKNDHTKVIRVEESDEVRVGISAFLPKDSLYTRQEASEAIRKQQRKGHGDIYVRAESSEEESSDRVVYRYVKRTKSSAPNPPLVERPEVSVENLAAMNLMNDRSSPRPDAMRTTMKVNVGSDYEDLLGGGTVRYPAQNVQLAEIRRVERPAASDSVSSSKTSTPGTVTARDHAANSAKASVSVRTSVASSKSNVTATARVVTPSAPGFSESEIRMFARDEVERYRQAERMMHEHPSAYAHGRMVPVVTAVPVERRIEAVSDVATPKPWEAPASPPREATFATVRAKATSRTSQEGRSHTERAPSEDSRHWYHPNEASSSTSKSTTSKASTPTVRQESTRRSDDRHHSRPHGNDTGVTIQHKRKMEMSGGLPDGDPPAVVGLKEEAIHAKQPSADYRQKYESDIIEVTEEIELQPGAQLHSASIQTINPAVSQRVKVLRGGHDSQRRQPRSLSPQESREVSHSREASLRTDKSYWEAERVVRPASVRSSARQDESVRGSEHYSHMKTDIVVQETGKVYMMPSPKQFLANLSTHGRSEDDSWYASRVNNVKKHRQVPEQPSSPPKPQDDADDKTIWPQDETPIRPAASSRMSTVEDCDDDDDWDWEYRRRILTASDRPPGRIEDESAPGRHYVGTERMFRRRRPSHSSAREQEPSTYSNREEQRQLSEAQHIPEIVISRDVDWKSPQDRGRGPYMRTSEESAHVRFASKVEFSPTPPRSDEYLPEQVKKHKPSSASSKGSYKKSALRNQLDGGASEPPESAESLLAEYETTRAFRSRSIEKEEDLDYVSAKSASSAKGSARAGSATQHSTRSEPRSFRSQGSHWSTRTRDDEEDRRSGHSACHSSPADEADTATQLSRNRRLARALSESPSRERLRQDDIRVQQQMEQRSETVISRGRREDWGEPEDGKGPYREEARTESMDVLYGSGHGGPKSKQREYVVRER
jgi:hypothetical protein